MESTYFLFSLCVCVCVCVYVCLTYNSILTFCKAVLRGRVLKYRRSFEQVPSFGSYPCSEDLL